MRESQDKGLKRSTSSFRSSKGRNHPFEDTPSPQYKRNIAQVSQFYISLWPNENQSGSYHETLLWPWQLSGISVYHQLYELVGKRRSISRKGIYSWWRSLSIFFHLSGHGCLLLTLGGLEVAFGVERLGWLSIESSAESMYHVSSSNTPPSTVNHGKRIGLGWATL
jgi:hypothetical protein